MHIFMPSAEKLVSKNVQIYAFSILLPKKKKAAQHGWLHDVSPCTETTVLSSVQENEQPMSDDRDVAR